MMLLTHEQFARTLYQGLGRPIVYAHTHDTTPFKDVILQACLYNSLYDRLIGVDRVPYLYTLITATGGCDRFNHPRGASSPPDRRVSL